jgi:hypothetical protein
MSKKNFKDSTVGKIILGAATMINPTLGNVLQGVTSPKEALAEISKSGISVDNKIKLQQMIYDQQNKEMEEISNRWIADSKGSWLSKNVRPLVLIWCIVVFSFAGILDSIDNVGFTINALWNDTFEKIMMSTVISYFGSRGIEKSINVIKK